MHPLPFYHPSLPAMPPDIVGSIIKHLSDDTLPAVDRQRPVVRTVALWSRTCHASYRQLKPWMEANASPDKELQHRLDAAIAYGEPLLTLWQTARPFVHATSPTRTLIRINEQLARLELEPRCAALMVLGSERAQLSTEQQIALRNYLIREKVITASDDWRHPVGADEACNVAGYLTMNGVDFILKGKCNAEQLAHAVMQALVELPLEARIQGLNALLGIVTSVDPELYVEALQPRMAHFLPPHWDRGYMQSPRGQVLLAALRMLATKRHPEPMSVAQPVLRFLGQWLDQLPPAHRHVSSITRTPHHEHVLLVIQCMYWMVRRDAEARQCFADEFVARGLISAAEFSVLEQHPELTRPGENLCFDQLGTYVAAMQRHADEVDNTRPARCALV